MDTSECAQLSTHCLGLGGPLSASAAAPCCGFTLHILTHLNNRDGECLYMYKYILFQNKVGGAGGLIV